MRCLLLAVLACSLTVNAAAAQSWKRQEIATPAQPNAIPLDTGGVANATAPESWSFIMGDRQARNVQAATLTPFLPDPAKATGAAVVVAPGGAFRILSMDNEGYRIAAALSARGIAAFVLKYRLVPTPADPDALQRELVRIMTGAATAGHAGPLPTPADAVTDGKAALALVRRQAAKWGVDPKRVGMMGFSAGAMTTLEVALSSSPETMPAFIAPIYGTMTTVDVPADAPPMFNALAADDPLFAHHGFGLIEAWQKARRPVEFHLYQKGGHGFGPGMPGTTSTDWIDAFVHWLGMNGFLKAKS
jgi:acetyl esterase/lipase